MTSPWKITTRPAARAGALVFLVIAACAAFPAGAQPADRYSDRDSDGLCTGKSRVTRLAGPHAVIRTPIKDVAALRSRLPELEASLRAVVGRDPELGPPVADALIAALRSGGGEITERKMQRQEEVRWMAYQPSPGQFEAITPACLRLSRDYDAFEILVEVPDQVRPAPAPVCNIRAQRSCGTTNPVFQVDISGSSPNARVSYSSGGGSSDARVSGQSFTVPDDQPNAAVTFTVQAEGPGQPARTARVYRFLMPKICGNLAYLGQGVDRTLEPAGPAQTCRKSSATLPACRTPEPEPPPATSEIDTGGDDIPEACEGGWTVRPFVFGYRPNKADFDRPIDLNGQEVNESFTLDDGLGLGASVEKRFNSWLGWEVAAMAGRGDSEYKIERGATISESDHHTVNFYAVTTGPNFHLGGCSAVDAYIGPFIGYGGFGDPNYWAYDHHFAATFDGDFVWGGQVGLDFPGFGEHNWGWHTGLRYIDLDQETDAGEFEVNPFIFEVGVTFQF